MTKKSGLGKGLDALFGPVPEEEKQQETDKFKNLKVTEIEPNKEQARKVFDQEALEELADSTYCCCKKRWILFYNSRRKKMESL